MNGKTYKVIQKHTSQADWTPDIYKLESVLILRKKMLKLLNLEVVQRLYNQQAP